MRLTDLKVQPSSNSLLQASSTCLPALSLPVDPCLGGGSGWWVLRQCSTALLALLLEHISLHHALPLLAPLCMPTMAGVLCIPVAKVSAQRPCMLPSTPADAPAPAVLQYYLNPVAWTLCE